MEPTIHPASFQPQAHDTVLREEERKRGAFARVCFYVAANSVRAELVEKPADWKYTGCVVGGYPTLNPVEDDFWEKFWKIFAKLRTPDAGNVLRPPMG